jgi:hypothetical protein
MTAMSAAEARQHPLYPRNLLGARLCEIFSYWWQAIIGVNETDPEWQTITKYPLRPRVLWSLWQDAGQLVGVRFGSSTGYALIDIDRESAYHPAQSSDTLHTIRAALETIGIYRTVLIRSSYSGGLHLYIPLPILLPTFGIATALKQCLEAQGLVVAPGQLEIFPNTKAYALPGTTTEYNAHRLPLQPSSGSCLLDREGHPINGGLEQFFALWDTAAAGQDLEELHAAITTARSNRRARRKRSVRIVEDWQHDLQTEMQEGWTGYGQTNHLLKTIACYGVVFEGLKGEALADYVLDTALNAEGYERFCRHQHEIRMRCTVWARAAAGYYWALGEEPQRVGQIHDGQSVDKVIPINKNQLRAEDAKRRIREAVLRLKAAGELPSDATERLHAIADAAKSSSQTLYRYRELWHPNHCQHIETGRCETVSAAGVTADLTEEMTLLPKLSEASGSGKFHTLAENMKSEALLPGSVSEISFNSNDWVENSDSLFSDQNPRRTSFTKSVTATNLKNGQTALSNETCKPSPTVTPGSPSSTPRPSSTAESTLLDPEPGEECKPSNISKPKSPEISKNPIVVERDTYRTSD